MTQGQRWTRLLSGVFGFSAFVASGAIERSLHASPWAMRWVLSAYLLPLALLLPVGTRLGNRFGHHLTLVAGLGGFAAAAAVGAWAPDVGVLIAARATAGAGAAVAFSGALGLAGTSEAGRGVGLGHLGHDFDTGLDGLTDTGFMDPDFIEAGFSEADLMDDHAPRTDLADREFCGSTAAAGPAKTLDVMKSPRRRLGVTLGVILVSAPAGMAVQGSDWRGYYALLAVLAASLAVVARWLTPAAPRGRWQALDLGGCAAAAVAVLGPVWALNRSAETGWATAEVIGTLLAGCCATAILALWHLPVGPLHRRRFLAANIGELLFAASIFGPTYPAVRDLQWVCGTGPLIVGVGLIGWAVGAAWPLVTRYAAGRRMLPKVCRPAGLGLHCAGLAVLAWALHGGGHAAGQPAGLTLSAVGVGLALAADPSLPGLPGLPGQPAVGTMSLLGAVAGVAVLAATVPGFGTGTAASYHGELASALLMGAVLAAGASFASVWIPGVALPAPRAGFLGRLFVTLLPGADVRSGSGSRSDPPMESAAGHVTATAFSA